MSKDRWVLTVILLTWIIAGSLEPFLADGGEPFNASSTFHVLILAVLLVIWCAQHAKSHDVIASKNLLIGVFFIPFVALPYYLFNRFGIKSGAKKLLLGLIFLGLCIFAFFASWEISWHLLT